MVSTEVYRSIGQWPARCLSIPSGSSPKTAYGFKVQRDGGQLLLKNTNDFALGCCREKMASFRPDLYHIFCGITSRIVAIMLAGDNAVSWASSITMSWSPPRSLRRENHGQDHICSPRRGVDEHKTRFPINSDIIFVVDNATALNRCWNSARRDLL